MDEADADAFDPSRLSPGGFLLARSSRRTEGLRELYKRIEMTAGGLRWDWVTIDDFHQEFDTLAFRVEAGGTACAVVTGPWSQTVRHPPSGDWWAASQRSASSTAGSTLFRYSA